MKKKQKPNNIKIAKAILRGKLNAHLGYDSNSRVQKRWFKTS